MTEAVRNSLQRLVVAAVAIPALLGVVYWGGLPLALVLAAAGWLGTRELFGLAQLHQIQAIRWLGLALAAAFPLGAWWRWGGFAQYGSLAPWTVAGAPVAEWPYLFAGVTLVVLVAALWARRPDQQPLAAAAITLLGPVYCSALLCFALGIRYGTGPDRHWPATWIVFFPLAITWICDTAAMYAGKVFQGPKLWPLISPGKTRVGAVAGVVGGVVAALVYSRLALRPSGVDLGVLEVVGFGVAISIAAQLGDLTESLFKREAGVKDSSHLIPGHGGVLDRLDALYFVLPVAAILYRILGVV